MIYLGNQPVGIAFVDLWQNLISKDILKNLTFAPGYVTVNDGTIHSQDSVKKEMVSNFITLENYRDVTWVLLSRYSDEREWWIGIGEYTNDGTFRFRREGTSRYTVADNGKRYSMFVVGTSTSASDVEQIRVSMRTYTNDFECIMLTLPDFLTAFLKNAKLPGLEVTQNA